MVVSSHFWPRASVKNDCCWCYWRPFIIFSHKIIMISKVLSKMEIFISFPHHIFTESERRSRSYYVSLMQATIASDHTIFQSAERVHLILLCYLGGAIRGNETALQLIGWSSKETKCLIKRARTSTARSYVYKLTRIFRESPKVLLFQRKFACLTVIICLKPANHGS